ncbi:MAG TPA: formate dehydrogenase accessory sulfurtransferase FdhD [Candidatus Nitrosotenuis sp.]|nr:formate dehydrogenase accessory sulfurtransferase FdhD [Candidatus Nitrosotenuis sp.]
MKPAEPGEARPSSTVRVRVGRHQGGRARWAWDRLATEEPMEIRVAAAGPPASVAVTMRTPGHDFELAAGFLFSEGILDHPGQVRRIAYCHQGPATYNVVTVELDPGIDLDLARLSRHVYTSSSCGLCGRASLEAVSRRCPPLPADDLRVPPSLLHGLPARLRAAQALFGRTGGLHAVSLFDARGNLLATREDVGRHNAMDKLVGGLFLTGSLPACGRIVLFSGRASFELVQKAALAGIPLAAALGAPSSLAVELARAAGMTLVGFLSEGRFNVYCGAWRLACEAAN